MVFINEWLPNPTGNDAKGEFVELFNDGLSRVNLDGWFLKTSGKKQFFLSDRFVPAHEYTLLFRSVTKLNLKNSDESLSLYDPNGRLIDQSSFKGSAQDGKSLSRINDATDTAEHFAWSNPTPGAANKITVNTIIASNRYELNVPLNEFSFPVVTVILMALGVAVAFVALMLYSVKQYESISQLFFGRDDGLW